jgi:hypothetical protein
MATKPTPAPATISLATLAPAIPLAKRILSLAKRYDAVDAPEGTPQAVMTLVLALIRAPAAAGKKETGFQVLASAAGRIPSDFAAVPLGQGAGEGMASVAVNEAVRTVRAALAIARDVRSKSGV